LGGPARITTLRSLRCSLLSENRFQQAWPPVATDRRRVLIVVGPQGLEPPTA